MNEKNESIRVFVKLFEQIAEAQQIINKDYAPEDLEKVEFKSIQESQALKGQLS